MCRGERVGLRLCMSVSWHAAPCESPGMGMCKVPDAACMCTLCVHVCRDGTVCVYVEGRCHMCSVCVCVRCIQRT